VLVGIYPEGVLSETTPGVGFSEVFSPLKQVTVPGGVDFEERVKEAGRELIKWAKDREAERAVARKFRDCANAALKTLEVV
jgi:hypothetical protein